MKVLMNLMGILFLLIFGMAIFLLLVATNSTEQNLAITTALISLVATALFFFLGRVAQYMANHENLSVMIYRQLLEKTADLNIQEELNAEVNTFRAELKKVNGYI